MKDCFWHKNDKNVRSKQTAFTMMSTDNIMQIHAHKDHFQYWSSYWRTLLMDANRTFMGVKHPFVANALLQMKMF
jgi:hypothetical protein